MSDEYKNSAEGHANIERDWLTKKQRLQTTIREAASFSEPTETTPEFGVEEMRNQIADLERQQGYEITKEDLSLAETITNPEKKRTTFYFKLEKSKALKCFGQLICYNFMNEAYRKTPRYEIDRVYYSGDDINDESIIDAKTIAKYKNGVWQ